MKFTLNSRSSWTDGDDGDNAMQIETKKNHCKKSERMNASCRFLVNARERGKAGSKSSRRYG